MLNGWHVEDSGTGEVDFVIGMEWTALWRLARRPWVSWWFIKMLRSKPSTGLLGTRLGWRRRGPVVLQRWASRAQLDGWARDGRQPHAPSWARFRRIAGGTADWGIWHELRPRPAPPGSGRRPRRQTAAFAAHTP